MTQRSIYQNLDPTLNGYHPDWYDKNAKLISRKPGCSVISYQCNGTGILYDYSIFPGIDLIFMDFNCSDIFDEPNEMRNVLEIRHYQEGRVEFEFEGDKVFHLQQDEFCVNGMLNNERFISKAPEAKVQEEREKLEKYTQMLQQVQERMAGLKK